MIGEVFVAWYHPHVFWGHQVTNLLHIAIALTIDLGLERPPGCPGIDFKTASTKAIHGAALINRVPALDEHRALAGVFYLTSMLSSTFKKIEASSYTKYLDDCLVSLEKAQEYESDLLLVQMVRLQHLAEVTHTTELSSAPISMYVKAYEADLNKLKVAPSSEEDSVFLKLQYLTTEILMWELPLIDLQENKAKPLRSHLEYLYRCIEAIKAFVEVYFSIPTDAYLTMPFSVFGQFAHSFIVLTKLASLEADGWDFKSFQMDFCKIIEDGASRFDSATQSSPDGLQVNNEAFGKWANRMRWMKQIYEAKFLQEDSAPDKERQDGMRAVSSPAFPGDVAASAGGTQQPTPPDEWLSGDFFNQLDDNFWNNFTSADFDMSFSDALMAQ